MLSSTDSPSALGSFAQQALNPRSQNASIINDRFQVANSFVSGRSSLGEQWTYVNSLTESSILSELKPISPLYSATHSVGFPKHLSFKHLCESSLPPDSASTEASSEQSKDEEELSENDGSHQSTSILNLAVPGNLMLATAAISASTQCIFITHTSLFQTIQAEAIVETVERIKIPSLR